MAKEVHEIVFTDLSGTNLVKIQENPDCFTLEPELPLIPYSDEFNHYARYLNLRQRILFPQGFRDWVSAVKEAIATC